MYNIYSLGLAHVHVCADLLHRLAGANLLLDEVAEAATANKVRGFFDQRARSATGRAHHTHSGAQRIIAPRTHGVVQDVLADIAGYAADVGIRAGVELRSQYRCAVSQFRVERRSLVGGMTI